MALVFIALFVGYLGGVLTTALLTRTRDYDPYE